MKKVFISYRYKDRPRFDLVREIAARLRFFSIEVVLDQRSLLYGEDIKAFMAETIRTADALLVLLSKDYNHALLQDSGPGQGVRFEVSLALQERNRRPSFRVIPILLDSSSPVPPFDRLKCARPGDVAQIVTELGLVEHLSKSRVLADRYRLDNLIETRGLARVFDGRDLVLNVPVQVYMVPATEDLQGERFRLFERVLIKRSMAFSPFLLNLRDSYISADGAYYLVTEKFQGTDLGVPLHAGHTTHPFGALCMAYQLALGLYELHNAGVLQGGLAPRAVRQNPPRTLVKVTDFEFAKPTDTPPEKGMDGYPLITPPERFAGSPPTVQQDIYQLANLVFWVVCGFPIVSRCFPNDAVKSTVFSEDPRLQEGIASALSKAVQKTMLKGPQSRYIEDNLRRFVSNDFINGALSPFLARCLHPDPHSRPQNMGEVLEFLATLRLPPAGRLIDSAGLEIPGALYPEYQT